MQINKKGILHKMQQSFNSMSLYATKLLIILLTLISLAAVALFALATIPSSMQFDFCFFASESGEVILFCLAIVMGTVFLLDNDERRNE
jgi:hypothetical protein